MSAFNVSVSFNSREADRAFLVAEKQARFARALAITMTAGRGRVGGKASVVGSGGANADLRAGLKDHFTIRGSQKTGGYMGKSMRSTFATRDKPWADVGTIDRDLADQATGGLRKENEAVPIVGKGKPRTNIRTRIRPSKFPRELLGKTDKATGTMTTFVAKIDGTVGVYKRSSRPRAKVRGEGKTRKKYPVSLLYVFKKQVRIPVRWPFHNEVRRSVGKHWQMNAKRALERAFATAR